ncbi:MAG: hypothetical protein CMJ78_23985 [Planctomycetaceae bacterium]|nr:hypothetical protein [Planctomycetaceae bacterium]
MAKIIDGHRVIRQLSVAEAEAEHEVVIDGKPVPFGYSNARWRSLLAQFQDGDELWFSSSSNEDWDKCRGFEGIVLIRNGKAIDSFVTFMN